MKPAYVKVIGAAATVAAAIVFLQSWQGTPPRWTDDEITVLRSLWLESLPELPPDPSNAVADDPAAAAFGKQLFFDPRLSANGSISCSTCHQPERHFTDGLQKGQAIGRSGRNTPSIVGTAYSPWLFWDGRSDSLWSQALGPIEDPNEHATDRRQVIRLIAEDAAYKSSYESIFGALPELSDADQATVNTIFSNFGKAIAAFERTVMPAPSRFDEYVAALVDGGDAGQAEIFSEDEVWGLRYFIGEAKCTQCHNGPLLTNHEFHNTGVINFPGEVPDKGRVSGVRKVLQHPFNCRGQYSDDVERQCAELEFVRTGLELVGAVKTPSLRNLEHTQPFMHKGQIATLREVLDHYNVAPDAMIGHNEAEPLQLNRRELRQLEAFLRTLFAPVAQPPGVDEQT